MFASQSFMDSENSYKWDNSFICIHIYTYVCLSMYNLYTHTHKSPFVVKFWYIPVDIPLSMSHGPIQHYTSIKEEGV